MAKNVREEYLAGVLRPLGIGLIAVLLLSVRCANDPLPAIGYDLTIQNQTATAYDQFMNVDLDAQGFRPAGHVPANGQLTLRNLVIGAHYTFRLALVGNNATMFVHERAVTSLSDDVVWVVN
jgi:hypothetical protein